MPQIIQIRNYNRGHLYLQILPDQDNDNNIDDPLGITNAINWEVLEDPKKLKVLEEIFKDFK